MPEISGAENCQARNDNAALQCKAAFLSMMVKRLAVTLFSIICSDAVLAKLNFAEQH
jgi:hypothetical protein